ncbi:MAG TPA: DUF2336 domain-containing protein [Rhizomicrobium sp.]|nr:DUF2336 domain-containing protein [Rhizomicrobium sp.]
MSALAANSRKQSAIWLSVATLFSNQAPCLHTRERSLMRDILRRLAGTADAAQRIVLAERIADDPAVPLELVLHLVDDSIEIAVPLILRSAALDEENLLALIARADVTRKILCAQRARIGERVAAALAKSDEECVLLALVHNSTAQISTTIFEILAEKSRRFESLREPLARRSDLPAILWTKIREGLPEATKSLSEKGPVVPRPNDSPEASDNARKLIDKLAVAGQLGAGFLMRVLLQGQTELFDIAFARLLDLGLEEFRAAFYASDPQGMALACRAVGIDRSVFPTVWGLSTKRRAGPRLFGSGRPAALDSLFALPKPEARARLHACS